MSEDQVPEPEIIDAVPGELPEVVPAEHTQWDHDVPGYKVPKIGGPSDGVKYESGMPLPLDPDTNPQADGPQVSKLT